MVKVRREVKLGYSRGKGLSRSVIIEGRRIEVELSGGRSRTEVEEAELNGRRSKTEVEEVELNGRSRTEVEEVGLNSRRSRTEQ